MKTIDKILGIVLVIITALVINYSVYPLWANVSNYENLLPPSGTIDGIKTLLSGVPLYMFVAVLVTILFYFYKVKVLKRNDLFTKKHYARLGFIFSTIGFISALVVGFWVYDFHFFGPYMFKAYPFVSLLVHGIIGGIELYMFADANYEINKNNLEKTNKSSVGHIFFTIAEVAFVLFALGRFGAFLNEPNYWSNDSIYVLPYIIQLIIPFAILVCYLLNRDVLHSKLFGLIATIVILLYTIFSMVYFIELVKMCEEGSHEFNSTIYINPLSQIQNPGRLLTGPINETIMYVVCLVLPVANLVIFPIKAIINKNKK